MPDLYPITALRTVDARVNPDEANRLMKVAADEIERLLDWAANANADFAIMSASNANLARNYGKLARAVMNKDGRSAEEIYRLFPPHLLPGDLDGVRDDG